MNPMKQTPMQRVVTEILKRHGLLMHFDQTDHVHLRLDNDPYLPLVIEQHGIEVSVAHYFVMNGDLMRDPEWYSACGATNGSRSRSRIRTPGRIRKCTLSRMGKRCTTRASNAN